MPYAALREGFNFRGRRVPFLSRGFGIYRSREAQRGPAALSVNSSYKQDRYQDEQIDDGVLYRYQGDDPDNYFNRWLRSAHLLDVPIVYFVGTCPNWYRPIYPTYVERDEPAELRVLLTFGKMRGPTTSASPSTSRTRSSGATSSARSSSESTRRSSAAPFFPHTRTAARSVGCAKFGYSTPRTSWAMPRSPASRS